MSEMDEFKINTADVKVDGNNKDKNKIESIKSYKRSLFAELNTFSGIFIAALALVIAFCIGLYVYMCIVPAKHVYLYDKADVFTDDEEEELLDMAKKLSKSEDLNVLIYSTRDKGSGYGSSREERARYAGDMYTKYCVKEQMRDNSGFCILIDLENDEPGKRFFWLFTNGTAYYTLSDDEVESIFMKYKSTLQDEEYYDAFFMILRELQKHDYTSFGLYFAYLLIILIPMFLAWIVTLLIKPHHKLDIKPSYSTYTAEKISNGSVCTLKKRSVRVVVHESSTGSSSGGGGFSGGGGGGGHSGGGGGFF
ncbi:MAG: TPM domain-containing protein [Clostridia bacterium]|nr:TPM domain-containing protein [Clostridia bacterium]